ncbi:MAG: FAD-dependent thymidylate synthase, partial [Gemmatimonadota bacterium]
FPVTTIFVSVEFGSTPRAWRTMLELRSSEAAEFEIRRMAIATLRVLQQEAPAFFSDFEIYVAADRVEAARIIYHKV